MDTRRFYGRAAIAVIFSISLLLGAVVPAYAADMTGKTVTSVVIDGNKAIPEQDIRPAIKIKPGDKLTPEAVKADLQAIYELGYFYDVITNFTEVPEGAIVKYTVVENPELKDIIIKGNTKMTTAQIMDMITLKKGQLINTKTLNDNMRSVETAYHNQGYILTRVSDVAMQPDGTLTLTVNEGILEGITVKGNEKTKPYVITREMRLKTGEPFNAKAARRSMQRVYNLGYFEDVNMKLNPGREPNAVILEASVVEQKTGVFSIGGGYSEADGMIGIVELGDNNFRGTGDKIKLHVEFGGNAENSSNNNTFGHNYELSYTHPWLDDKETSLGFSVYDMTNQYTDYYSGGNTRSTYNMRRKGMELTLGRPQDEYSTNYITLKHRKDMYVKYVSGPENYSTDTDYLENNFGVTNSITLLHVLDTRDNVFNPAEGKRYSVSAEFAGKGMGGDFSFNKYVAEARQYFRVGKHDQVVAAKLTLGYATGTMPERGRFNVGGSETLRGYEDEQFKGNKMLAATAEYRFPLVKKIQGVVFSDVGGAWDNGGYSLDNLHASVGFGIRLMTPIGPVRLDYAKGSEMSKFHFSFGGQF